MKKPFSLIFGMLAVLLALFSATPAYAVTAHRYWSDGSGHESKWFATDVGVQPWIAGKAKGTVDNGGGWSIDWIVLRDRGTDHHYTSEWRGYGYPYWNQWDPQEKTLDIQYTLRYMGHSSLIADNYYGNNTANAISVVQRNNGLTRDGITGAGTYEVVASQDN